MLSWEVPTRLRAIRFSLIWGGLAIALFICAGVLTAIILRYNPQPGPLLRFGMTVPSDVRPSHLPVVSYSQPDGHAQLSLYFLPSSGVFYVSPRIDRCEEYNQNPFQKVDISSRPGETISRVTFRVTSTGPGSDSMQCYTEPLVASESFIDRRLDTENFHPHTAEKQIGWILGLNAGDADKLRFSGGLPGEQPEIERILEGSYRTTARWESLSAESIRDILLVVIGSLIALGAATLLEALRPMIDVLSAKADKVGG